MRRLRDIPIRQKLVFIAMGTSVLALVLACAIFVVYDWFSFRRELAEEVATTAEMLGYNCAASLSFDEAGVAARAAKYPRRLRLRSDRQGIRFLSPRGLPAAAVSDPKRRRAGIPRQGIANLPRDQF